MADVSHLTAPEEEITQGDVLYASIVAFIAWIFSVYDYIMFGLLLPVIAVAFHWSTAVSVAVNTWILVGAFVIALTVGPITDYFGRRNALMITTAGAAISSGLTALGLGTLYTIFVRSFSGLGESEQAVNTTYLTEIFGKNKRGFSYSWIQGGWPVGVILAATTSSLLLPSIGWRGVFAVATLPAIIIVLLRLRLKESPRFRRMQQVRALLKEGRDAEAEVLGDRFGIDVHRSSRFTIRQLFGTDIIRHTVFITLGYLVQWIAAPMFVILATTILTQGKHISFSNSLLVLIISNVAGFIGYIVLGYVGDRIGRRNTVLVGWIVAGLLWGAMLGFAHTFTAVIVLFALSQFFEAGTYAPFFTYAAESFPTRMRGTGAAFVNAMGGIGSIIGSGLFAFFLSRGMSVLEAGLLLGMIPQILAAFFLFGAKNVPPRTELEAIHV